VPTSAGSALFSRTPALGIQRRAAEYMTETAKCVAIRQVLGFVDARRAVERLQLLARAAPSFDGNWALI